MAEFDRRWKRLVTAARRAEEPERELGEAELARLARLARPRVACQAGMQSSAWRAAALAAAVLGSLLAVHCAWPDRAAFDAFARDVRTELAALPRSVPRAPRLVSGARVLEALPDLGGALHSLPNVLESSP